MSPHIHTYDQHILTLLQAFEMFATFVVQHLRHSHLPSCPKHTYLRTPTPTHSYTCKMLLLLRLYILWTIHLFAIPRSPLSLWLSFVLQLFSLVLFEVLLHYECPFFVSLFLCLFVCLFCIYCENECMLVDFTFMKNATRATKWCGRMRMTSATVVIFTVARWYYLKNFSESKINKLSLRVSSYKLTHIQGKIMHSC